MGSKPAKLAAAESPTTEGGTPPKVSPEQEANPKAESSLSSDNSPSLPAYDPKKEETTGLDHSSAKDREMDDAMLDDVRQEEAKKVEQEETVTPPVPVADDHDAEEDSKEELAKEDSKEEPVGDDLRAELVEETPKEEPVEENKAKEDKHSEGETQEERKESDVTLATNDASQKVEMPPLALDKINDTPPVPKPEEDDPDLMAPPVVLTDAMSSLKDTDIGPGAETSAKRLPTETSDAVMLASPITHHEVSLVEPVPVTTPAAEPPERDSISIEDKVSAADADSLSNPDGMDEPSSLTLEPRALDDVPEDSISLTSSAARGEDEMLMNIMGASVAFPAATSNESVRGSVAVSEMTFDESQWETSQNIEAITPQPSTEFTGFPSMLHVFFTVKADASVAVRFTYGELPEEEAVEEEDVSQIVVAIVDMIFDNVIQTANAEEARQKEKAPDTEQVPEMAPIVKAPAEESVSEEPPKEELPPPEVDTIVTNVFLSRNVEEPIVTVDMEEIGGSIKVRLFHSGQEMSLQKYPSRVSDNQSSVILKTPFTDIVSESQDLSGTLENVPVLETEELEAVAEKTSEKPEELEAVAEKTSEKPEELEAVAEKTSEKPEELEAVAEKTSEKPEETVEMALQEASDLAAEVVKTLETKPEEAEAAAHETLSPSTSGDAKKPKRVKSLKKKSLSGEKSKKQSPGLRTSLSDGTASVDSTGAPDAKPKPQSGRSTRGRGRGRGRLQAK